MHCYSALLEPCAANALRVLGCCPGSTAAAGLLRKMIIHPSQSYTQIIKFTLILVPIKSVAQRCTQIYDFDHYSIWITRIWITRISSGPENHVIQVHSPCRTPWSTFLAHKAMLIFGKFKVQMHSVEKSYLNCNNAIWCYSSYYVLMILPHAP